MVIELSGVQFGHTRDFKIERARSAFTSIRNRAARDL